MKKAVAIFLACCMIMLTLSFAANAETGNTVGSDNAELEAAIAAVVDKLDPSVIECLYSATGLGTAFVIQYHGVTRDELYVQLRKVSSPTSLDIDLGADKAVFCLNYSSVVSVAGLDCVDYITLFEKITQNLQAQLDVMDDDDVIETLIKFYYFPYNEEDIVAQTEEACGFKKSEITTVDQAQLFNSTRNRLIKEAKHNKAMEILEKAGINYSDVVGGWDPDNVNETLKRRYMLTKAQILQAATVEEIVLIDDYNNQQTQPTISPTNAPTEVPTEASTTRPTTPPTIAPTTPPTIAPTTPPTEAPTEPKDLYRERLKERYNLSEFDGDLYTYQLMSYQELYYHRDSSGEIDWALIQCYCNIATPVEMTAVVGNRVLHPGTAYYPFDTTFGIYDVKNDKFIDPSWSGQDYLGGKEAYKYDGFVRAFDEIVGGGMGEPLADVDYRGKGRPLGDIDNNGELDITDVTMVQRCDAQIMEYPATDELWLTYDYNGDHYYSDFNLDGERDIVDATCIQRYLVDMDYPIG